MIAVGNGNYEQWYFLKMLVPNSKSLILIALRINMLQILVTLKVDNYE